jgi:hypothetical protein
LCQVAAAQLGDEELLDPKKEGVFRSVPLPLRNVIIIDKDKEQYDGGLQRLLHFKDQDPVKEVAQVFDEHMRDTFKEKISQLQLRNAELLEELKATKTQEQIEAIGDAQASSDDEEEISGRKRRKTNTGKSVRLTGSGTSRPRTSTASPKSKPSPGRKKSGSSSKPTSPAARPTSTRQLSATEAAAGKALLDAIAVPDDD